MKLIRFANIIINQSGDVMVAVADHNLTAGQPIDVQLNTKNSFEIYQDGLLVGHVEESPPEAMTALATSKRVLLVEVGENGPTRIHEKVTVRPAE